MMKPSTIRLSSTLLAIALLSTVACTEAPGDENNENNTSDMTSNPDPDMTSNPDPDMTPDPDPDPDMTPDPDPDMTIPPASGWVAAGSACVSKVGTVWFDGQVGYMGCGEGANGAGLWKSEDGGLTWGAESERKFREVRVNDIFRAPDGVLYGAGLSAIDGFAAFSIDESGASIEPIGLYEQSNSASTKVGQGENIAVTEDGQILVDSLTGTTAAYKGVDTEMEEQEGLGEGFLSDTRDVFQVRRIVAHENKFYAVGEVINQPAKIFLPSKEPGATYHMTEVALQPDSRDGEALDLHVWSSDRALVVGHDQSTREGLIYYGQGDLYDKAAWTQIEPFDSGIEYQLGINAIAVSGDRVVAACEKIPTSQGGCVLESEDGGQTWKDITPETERGKIGRMWEVWIHDNGDVYVAGEGEGWYLKR